MSISKDILYICRQMYISRKERERGLCDMFFCDKFSNAIKESHYAYLYLKYY